MIECDRVARIKDRECVESARAKRGAPPVLYGADANYSRWNE